MVGREPEFMAERRKKNRVNSFLNFEANRGAAAEVAQFRLDLDE